MENEKIEKTRTAQELRNYLANQRGNLRRAIRVHESELAKVDAELQAAAFAAGKEQRGEDGTMENKKREEARTAKELCDYLACQRDMRRRAIRVHERELVKVEVKFYAADAAARKEQRI